MPSPIPRITRGSFKHPQLVWGFVALVSLAGLLGTYMLFVEPPPPKHLVIATGSTFSGNSVTGGNGNSVILAQSGTVTFQNSLIAGNTLNGGSECGVSHGVITDLGYNLEQIVKQAERRIAEIPGVSAKAVYGPPDSELEAFSSEVDLLAVGSRGYGPLKRLVLGSTANHLARHAGCSLLVLPRGLTADRSSAAEHATATPAAAV